MLLFIDRQRVCERAFGFSKWCSAAIVGCDFSDKNCWHDCDGWSGNLRLHSTETSNVLKLPSGPV